jgi:hypothetical protein
MKEEGWETLTSANGGEHSVEHSPLGAVAVEPSCKLAGVVAMLQANAPSRIGDNKM